MFYFLCVFKRGDEGRRKAEISYKIQAFRKHVQLHPLKVGAPEAFLVCSVHEALVSS